MCQSGVLIFCVGLFGQLRESAGVPVTLLPMTLSGNISFGVLSLLREKLNFRVKAAVAARAQDFMAAMATVGLSQFVIGSSHVAGHTVSLVFSSGKEDDMKVGLVPCHHQITSC